MLFEAVSGSLELGLRLVHAVNGELNFGVCRFDLLSDVVALFEYDEVGDDVGNNKYCYDDKDDNYCFHG